MDVDTYPFSFDQMTDQLDGIQQANSNYEENKSSCSQSHSLTQSFEEKSEESPDSKPKSRHADIQNLWETYFNNNNNRNEQDLIKDFPALIFKKNCLQQFWETENKRNNYPQNWIRQKITVTKWSWNKD